MKLDLERTWVNWFHVLVVAPLLLGVGIAGKHNPRMMFVLLVLLGLVVMGYHLYTLVMKYKKEGFFRGNNYYWEFQRHAGKEAFTPFSHPYTCESSAYYSYHDPTNSRACPCDLKGGEGKCAEQNVPRDATDVVSSKPVATAAQNSAAVNQSDYGMRTMAPVMGRNPQPSDYLL